MTIPIRATEEAIIRLLKAGHPLSPTICDRPEETRLPVFQSVEAKPVKDYGFEGTGRIVIARGRKDVWFVDIKRKDGKVTAKESENFVTMKNKLQERFGKNQKVTGWMIATSDIEKDAREMINKAECFVTGGAQKR